MRYLTLRICITVKIIWKNQLKHQRIDNTLNYNMNSKNIKFNTEYLVNGYYIYCEHTDLKNNNYIWSKWKIK